MTHLQPINTTVPYLDAGDSRPDRFDDSRTFTSKDKGNPGF
jgi:hypothetical protein